MKKTVFLLFAGVFLISCFDGKPQKVSSDGLDATKNRALVEEIVRFYFFDIAEKAKERTEFIGTALKKDRDFMLAIYSQDHFSAPVLSSSEKYTSPKIDYCNVGFFVEGKLNNLSEFGENRNFENCDKEFNSINDSLWVVSKHNDSGIYTTTATLVKNDFFNALKTILLQSDILVLYDSTIVNSTLDLDGNSAVLNSSTDSLSINGKKFGFQSVAVTDEINVLILTE
jgi:hypothetical protein